MLSANPKFLGPARAFIAAAAEVGLQRSSWVLSGLRSGHDLSYPGPQNGRDRAWPLASEAPGPDAPGAHENGSRKTPR